jgi:superfamily I DNA/RNA helicase
VAAAADVEEQIAFSIAKFSAAMGDLSAVEGELQSLRLAFKPSDLADLLAQIALRREEEEAVVRNTVNIMTMHKAKGLDACVVIVTGAEDELIPGPNNRAEERRLFYVSLTRARHALFITHAKRRTGQQARSGTGTAWRHHRTGYLDASGLTSRAGAAFVAAFVPDPDLLSPLPNPTAPGATPV